MRKLEKEKKKCYGLSPAHVSVKLLGKISRGFCFLLFGQKTVT